MRYCRLAVPQAPIKSVYYWGWDTNNDTTNLTQLANLKMPDGRPRVTNLHIFFNFPKNMDSTDPKNPVGAMTTCPGLRMQGNRPVACTAAECEAHGGAKSCDVYGTMEYQLHEPVDPQDPSKGTKLEGYGPILQEMRQQGTSIILSMLGGHGDLGPRTPLDPEGTQQLAQYLIDFVERMNWDGIDFDDEYYHYAAGDWESGPWGAGMHGSPEPMVSLYKALYEIGHPKGYTFSLPFNSPHLDLFPAINPYIDYAMDMAYSNSQTPSGGANLPTSKYIFGLGVDSNNMKRQFTRAENYIAQCAPTDPDRSKHPQGIMTFGGPWPDATQIINYVSDGLYPAPAK